MAIPNFQSIMLPLLRFLQDGKEHSLREAIETLATEFELSQEERAELLPSGQMPTFDNRVGWARTYMKKAGLIESTRRGFFRITRRGLDVLQSNPQTIDVNSLKRFPEFVEFHSPAVKATPDVPSEPTEEQNPEESIEMAYSQLRQALATEILETVKGCSPAFFERLVVDLVVKMGYGGTRRDAGRAIGGSGDGGIDGIINEDRLGLDIIYLQAKRWEGNVSRPEVQKFAGALMGHAAKKGIFITTSEFTKAAQDYVEHLDSKIILIDGRSLAELMIDYDVGVTIAASYQLKTMDTDYFIEE